MSSKERKDLFQPCDDSSEVNRDVDSIYLPVCIQNPKTGISYNVDAYFDTGAYFSVISPILAEKLQIQAQILPNCFLVGFDKSLPPIPRKQTTDSVNLFYGVHHDSWKFQVADIHDDFILLGRDFMKRFQIRVGPLYVRYPQELCNVTNCDDFEDLTVRPSLLSDPVELDAHNARLKEEIIEETTALLNEHVKKVPVNSFISHPDATIRILHKTGTEPKYITQYQERLYLQEYITAQIKKWLTNDKIRLWDSTDPTLGAYQRWNMPLHPVVTHTPEGDILKVRVCVDAKGINVNLIDDKFPLPNITFLYERLARS